MVADLGVARGRCVLRHRWGGVYGVRFRAYDCCLDRSAVARVTVRRRAGLRVRTVAPHCACGVLRYTPAFDMPSVIVAPGDTPAHHPKPKARRAEVRPRRIRVVFLVGNTRLGGTELNAVRTAERLDRERFDLSVVCLGEHGPLTERYLAMGIVVRSMPIRSFYGPSMVRSGLRFARLLRRERIEIVHAHDVYSNIFAGVWARTAGVPVLITSRRWWNELPNRMLRLPNRFAMWRSTAILANSAAVAKLAGAEAGGEGKVWTITNFVDEQAFGRPEPDERQRLRAVWGAPTDAIVIGCVARLHAVKDHAGLLRAFALVRARQPRAYLVLLGDGAERAPLEALVKDLGLERAVYFAGEQRSGTNLHRGCDISVLASRSEGFPNTLVEAMAAGNPVVATAVGGCVDAVVNEETGLLVPPGRPDELAAALLRLAECPDLREEFGRAGERRAREHFHVSSVVPALEAMYAQVLADRER